tara:strand:- start:879 stop:1337 length:459 start_codon:yes stop_codon:yes gene_type:complete
MDTKSFIKDFIKVAILCLLLCLLFSCTPQRRLNRLLTNHPELLEKDTIIVKDTVVVQNYNYDTTTIIRLHDTTTVINNERVVLKYYYDTLREIIHHDVECLGDTVYIETLVPIEKAVYKELSWWQKYKEFIYIGLFLILVLIILKKLGKIVL